MNRADADACLVEALTHLPKQWPVHSGSFYCSIGNLWSYASWNTLTLTLAPTDNMIARPHIGFLFECGSYIDPDDARLNTCNSMH